MMLNPKYRYIGLDFETTGLDPKKDEPIQIGIVELDVDGNIVKTFQSLIKPSKKTDELKHIVGFITGFSIADLEHAPAKEDIFGQISPFFGDDVILIGHNIQFDIDFLNNYFPGLSLAFSIDTFQLSQTLVHYAPSHALEVLVQHLQTKDPAFSSWMKKYALDVEDGDQSFHDALYDTKHSLALYMFFIEYIYELIKSYPNLATVLRLDLEYFAKILVLDEVTTSSPIKFPALERVTAAHRSIKPIANSLSSNTVHAQKYYIGGINIKTLLTDLATQKQVILSFSHPQKLDIAKQILHQLGVKNLGFLKEDQTINEKRFIQFLNKGIFSHEETLFVLKYLSHLSKGYGILDFNTKYDYQIYSFIKDAKPQTKYPIVLSTHGGLFSMLSDHDHQYRGYSIYFFDTESWYKNYNFFLSRPCDVYYTLNLFESLLYKQNIKCQLESDETHNKSCQDVSTKLDDFYQFFQILVGELFIETKKLFLRNPRASMQHDPILGHGDFYQTNLFLDKVRGYLEGVQEELSESDFAELSRQIAHLFAVFDSVMYINKRMYGSSDFYFTYSESAKFTSWDEFVELFNHTHITFFSNTNKQYKKLSDINEKSAVSLSFYEEKYTELIDHLSNSLKQKSPQKRAFFIVSTKKEQSKKIFEELYEKGIHKEASLLVENITGGVGKNIFKAKKTDVDRILIGGYSFLFYLYAQGVNVDEILIFNIKGPSRQYILDDIKRYAFT